MSTPISIDVVHGGCEYSRDGSSNVKIKVIKNQLLFQGSQQMGRVIPIGKDYFTPEKYYGILLRLVAENVAQLALDQGIVIESGSVLEAIRQIMVVNTTAKFHV